MPGEAAGARLLELAGIDLVLGGRAVLDHVDLVVRAREIVALIGPNGSGKTCLVRVALGLLPPTRGSVWRQPGLRVGYVPQRMALDPILPLTVARFLALGAAAGATAAVTLAEVGAPDLQGRSMHALSGGELRRVLLARALLREPDLLVLDEPAQGVDVHGQAELVDLIVGIRDQRSCGVLMVSHDLHLVMASTDVVVCLNRHVCCTGHPEAVGRDPAYLALLGPAAGRLAVYTHSHDHRHGTSGAVVGAHDYAPREHG